MTSPSPFITAVIAGNRDRVRVLYDASQHNEAMTAAIGHDKFNIAALLAELRTQKIAVQSRGRLSPTDFNNRMYRALSTPQLWRATNRPHPEYYGTLNDLHINRGTVVIDNWARAILSHFAGDVTALHGLMGMQEDMEFVVEVQTETKRSERLMPRRDPDWPGTVLTDTSKDFHIAYTEAHRHGGDGLAAGPVVVFVHGVPTNRKQWWPVQAHVSQFARTLSIDLLGMGESSKPLNYPDEAFDWVYDTFYLYKVITRKFPGEKVFLVSDDWGCGVCMAFAARHGDELLLAHVLQDPIALDGYPVSEIQAIGRDLYGAWQQVDEKHALAKDVPLTDQYEQATSDPAWQAATAGFDQTLVQIYKTMVHRPDAVYNQYSLRIIKETYVDTDYERSAADGPLYEDASSTTLRLNRHAIAVLAKRASRLAPAQLLPKAGVNPRGIDYASIRIPTLILWGESDSMMPANQAYRLSMLLHNAPLVHTHTVPRAGHFAATDQPDIVAEELLKFMGQMVGHGTSGGLLHKLNKGCSAPGLAQAFMGVTGIWKGDERHVLNVMNDLYGTKQQ